ncbi:MAG: hypothetical protein NVV66_08430 [Cellulomonas sp.]|uniref:hypothetical protein n=1 Tax=Cellulomonas sp. TaxID=40001 RepID=UPI00258676EB|nr:hypothetical protein [Cellulomonas sp.]MCR6704710.1 hypothetical protein [Cellulomonas sp.]
MLIRHGNTDDNPWGVSFMDMLHRSNMSHLFHLGPDLERQGLVLSGNRYVSATERFLPLYEGKMVTLFDHRAADVVRSATAGKRQDQPRYPSDEEKRDPNRCAMPIYWVDEKEVKSILPPRSAILGICVATSPTNERTVLSTLIPWAAVANNFTLLLTTDAHDSVLLQANLGSLVFDYAARQKIGGTALNQFYVKQFPVLEPSTYNSPVRAFSESEELHKWVVPRVAELVGKRLRHGVLGLRKQDFLARHFSGTPRGARQYAELDALFFPPLRS